MSDKPPSKLAAAGYFALGAAFFIEGVRLVKGIREKRPIEQLTPGVGESVSDAVKRTSGAITRSEIKEVHSIDERLAEIRKLANEGSLNPRVRERSLGILSRKCGSDGNRRWCVPEKNEWAEICALYASLRDPNSPTAMRYVRDHREVDQFTGADKSLFRLHAGDCDDQTIALLAMLKSVGYPVRARVIRAKGEPTWSHIYVLVGQPANNPSKWVPLDTTVIGAKPGWEAPKHLIEAVRDFEI